MAINTTWTNPAAPSDGIDLTTGDVLTETVWDKVVSNFNVIGGEWGTVVTSSCGAVGIASAGTNNSITFSPVGSGTVDVIGNTCFAGTVKIVDGTEASGKVLTASADGTGSWGAPSAGSLEDLTDTLIPTPLTGQLIAYNAASAVWKNLALTEGKGITITSTDSGVTVSLVSTSTVHSLESLTDTVIPTPLTGQLIAYNAASAVWKNLALTGGEGITITSTDSGITIDAAGGGGGSDGVTTQIPVWGRESLGSYVEESAITNIEPVVTAASGSIQYEVLSGTLPSGLALSTETGVISGTPASVGSDTTYEFVLRAHEGGYIADKNFAMTITNLPSNYFGDGADSTDYTVL